MIELPKGAKLITVTEENLNYLWERMADTDGLFGDDEIRQKDIFLRIMLDFNSVILGVENGILLMQKLIYGLRGEVHVSFWDHKLSPHTAIVKDCLIWAFLQYDLERVETFIPSYSRAVQRFLERKLGFRHEGTMRNRVWHDDKLIDIEVYAILKGEVLLNGKT